MKQVADTQFEFRTFVNVYRRLGQGKTSPLADEIVVQTVSRKHERARYVSSFGFPGDSLEFLFRYDRADAE